MLHRTFGGLYASQPVRAAIPPFFVFSKAHDHSARSVRFYGLAAPGRSESTRNEDLEIVPYDGRMNYRAVFTLLDIPVVERSWLRHLLGDSGSDHQPEAWSTWVETGRYDVARDESLNPLIIRTSDNQMRFDELHGPKVSRSTTLQEWLQELWGNGSTVSHYSTDVDTPSKQLKNRLSQPPSGREDSCLFLSLNEVGYESGRDSLIRGWAKGKWNRDLACVALVRLREGRWGVDDIVVSSPTTHADRIRHLLFPGATVYRIDGYPLCSISIANESAYDDSALPIDEDTDDPYTIDDALRGLFMSRAVFESAIGAAKRKRNVILQGPPGVGKTFVAKRLAYVLIGERRAKCVKLVQFHQSYSYEDFLRGHRPDGAGGFALKNGVFFEFCREARDNPRHNYVFVIDEINRGNLSRILGELMMLIEGDKRGPEFAVSLTYARPDEEPFFVPENLYIIGLMNTADRSLALVDYALRRRFAFIDLEPCFNESFKQHLVTLGVHDQLIAKIVGKLCDLNATIAADRLNLGPGYCIGHSAFCRAEEGRVPDDAWYRAIVQTEIKPLLEEYWLDMPERAEEQINQLLDV